MPVVILMVTLVERMLSGPDTADVDTARSVTEFGEVNFSLFVLNCLYGEGQVLCPKGKAFHRASTRASRWLLKNLFQDRNHT